MSETQPDEELDLQSDCCHALVIPLGDGRGRCVACGDDSFPMTADVAGECPCCGQYGGCTEACVGEVRMPWAVAKQALEELRRAYGGIVPSTVESTARALRRIMGEIVDIHVPGTTMFVTYDGAAAVKVRWKGTGEQAAVEESLKLLGLELAESPLIITAGGEDDTIIEASVRPLKRGVKP